MDEVPKVYCDANIFKDYADERDDYIRPLKDFAYEFFRKGWDGKYQLIMSDWLMTELQKNMGQEKIDEILEPFRKNKTLIVVNEQKGDRDKAKSISQHWHDPLHAILANRAKADYLVTRNIPDYAGCDHLVRIVFPEFI
jgi:hypothetical protein